MMIRRLLVFVAFLAGLGVMTGAAASTQVEKRSGLLLGIRQYGGYETLWIAPRDSDGQWQVVARGNGLLAPRRSGFWWIGVHGEPPPYREDAARAEAGAPVKPVRWYDWFVWATPVEKAPVVGGAWYEDAEDREQYGGVRTLSITFVGPDYVATSETFETHGPALSYNSILTVRPIDQLTEPEELVFQAKQITDVLGPEADAVVERTGRKAARANKDYADKDNLDAGSEEFFEGALTYWGIFRGRGDWDVTVLKGHSSGAQRGYHMDFDLPMRLPTAVTGAGPRPSWSFVLDRDPDAEDAFDSPTGDVTIIEKNHQLMVYSRTTGATDAAARKPLLTIPLNPTANIVMAQWATGSHVDRWTAIVTPLLKQGIPTPRDTRTFGK